MAEEFYKILPEEVASIYKEYIDENGIHRAVQAVNEQKDGTLLVSKLEYEKIKDDAEVKKIDWSKKEIITKELVDPKDTGAIDVNGAGDPIIADPK